MDAYQKLKVADVVYAAIADHEDATDAQLIAIVSKKCGTKITPARFKRALKSMNLP